MAPRTPKPPMHFKEMRQTDVPQGRNGKHKEIVTKILSDLDRLQKGAALKVPIAELGDTKEKVRSALNRASRKSGRVVATASDGTFLYVWNETPSQKPSPGLDRGDRDQKLKPPTKKAFDPQ